MTYQRNQKVIYKGNVYYFGWQTQDGYCTLFEEEDDCGMQDSFAVPLNDIELAPISDSSVLTKKNLRELKRRHQYGSYPSIQKVILELIDAIAEDKGWNLED